MFEIFLQGTFPLKKFKILDELILTSIAIVNLITRESVPHR